MSEAQSEPTRSGGLSISLRMAAAAAAASLPSAAAFSLLAPEPASLGAVAGATAAAALAAFGLVWLAARPTAAALRSLADGDATAEAGRSDEIGAIARQISRARSDVAADGLIIRALREAPDATLILDGEGRIRFANRIAETRLLPAARGMPGMAALSTLVGLPAASIHLDLEGPTGGSTPRSLRIDGKEVSFEVAELRDDRGTKVGRAVALREPRGMRDAEERILKALEAASSGDFAARVPTGEEAGPLGSVVNRMNERLGAFFAELAGMTEAMAAGRLSHRMPACQGQRLTEASDNLNAAFERVSGIVADVGKAAEGLRQAADLIADDAATLSTRTESQASSLEEAAATMEQMAANVRATAGNAEAAETLAREAATGAEAGKNVMSNAVAAMARIEESSSKISDIISVIDAIAFQTNLLALNAAVEAARAGEAGKGFAVVAAEVRTLAQRSSQAAKDISGLIQTSSTHVGEGVRLVQDTGTALEGIAAGIARTAGTIGDISAAVREQSAGVQETSQAVSHMDEATQQNSAMAEQSAAAARRMQNEARWLIDRVSFFEMAAGASAPVVRPTVAASAIPTRGPGASKAAKASSTPVRPAPRPVAAPSRPSSAAKVPPAVAPKTAPILAAKPAPEQVRPPASSRIEPMRMAAPAKPAARPAAAALARKPAVAAQTPAPAADDQDWTEF